MLCSGSPVVDVGGYAAGRLGSAWPAREPTSGDISIGSPLIFTATFQRCDIELRDTMNGARANYFQGSNTGTPVGAISAVFLVTKVSP